MSFYVVVQVENGESQQKCFDFLSEAVYYGHNSQTTARIYDACHDDEGNIELLDYVRSTTPNYWVLTKDKRYATLV